MHTIMYLTTSMYNSPAKKRNTPHYMPHSILKKTWLMRKVPAKFTHALRAVPAGRVSRG
jgi:hypothetical protein